MARGRQFSANFSGFDEAAADTGPLSSFDRSVESVVQQNPLAFGRPSFYEQEMEPDTTPALEGIDPDIAAANPLVVAPRPVKYMPIEQQIAWNQMQAEALNKQAGLQATLNNNRAAALERKHKLDQETQSTAILDAFDNVDPNQDNYQDVRNKLLLSNPAGALHPIVQNLIKMKDEVFAHRQGLQDKDTERQKTMAGNLDLARVNEAMKIANAVGDEALLNDVRYTANTVPLAALGKALSARTQLVNENLATQLRAYGISNAEIK